MKDILVLFSFRNHRTGYIEMLFRRLQTQATSQGRKIQLHRGSLKDLRIEVIDDHLEITESLTGRPLDSFDLTYFELWYKRPEQALAVARYCDRHGLPYFSQEMNQLVPMTKVGELALLADNAVRLPRSFTSSRLETKRAFRKHPPIAYPLIVKAADGYGGKNNFLVHDFTELKATLDSHQDLTFVIQEFIPNDCDYRCLVLGGKIRLVLQRTRSTDKDTHLNNTSAGAEGKIVPTSALSAEAQSTVLAAAAALGRSSFAGVDLMLHKDTGEPYILEVNQTPQIEIGAATETKMSAMLDYFEEIAR